MTLLIATRRSLLGLSLTGMLAPRGPAAAVPEAATLLAPGPEGGPTAALARRAAAGLPLALSQATALRVALLGGPDGITAANRFAASTPADGRLMLALPGHAGLALLVGDSRARYEPRHWPGLAASLGAAVVAGRGPVAGSGPIRLALPGPGAAEAAALLALDLLGRIATPVFTATGVTAEATVAAGAADALVLTGPAIPAQAAALGLTPWFAFDGVAGQRDPAAPQIPALAELLPDPATPDLLAAARAAGAALRVRGALVLPALTSADTVAMWRDAAKRWAETDQAAIGPGLRQAGPEEATAALATLCPGAEAAGAYRDWLDRRLRWRMG